MQQNAIRCIENLSALKHLTHLYLQRNRIQRIAGLDGLPCLRKLYLGMNEIRVLENLGALEALCELHVERQHWARLEDGGGADGANGSIEFTVDVSCIDALAVRFISSTSIQKQLCHSYNPS